MKKISKQPLNRLQYGPIKDVDGDMDCTLELAKVILSIFSKYDLSQKVKILVSIIAYEKGDVDFSQPFRKEKEKIISLRTMIRYYEKDTGEKFSIKNTKEKIESLLNERYAKAMTNHKSKVDTGQYHPVS